MSIIQFPNKRNQKASAPAPHDPKFDKKLSLQLDHATVALESDDPARQLLGGIWKRRLEKRIWGNA